MILKKIKTGKEYAYTFSTTFELEEKLKTNNYFKYKNTSEDDKLILKLKTDDNFKILKLLVILSPIFIATFDSSKSELDFFNSMVNKSNFKFGLYENFFQDFDINQYLNFYINHEKTEDIIVEKDLTVNFTINLMDNKYFLGLSALIEGLILDDKNRNNLLDYFAKIRNDIVINGRRSILANGIQAFYLSRYVVTWALDLYKIIEDTNPKLYTYIEPIYKLTDNLKRPIYKKRGF